MFLADYHTHSGISPDGSDSMAEMAEMAGRLGLTELAVTDHCDMSEPFDEAAHRRAYELGREACGGLRLLLGIELGEATHDISRAESILSRNPYDFVLGSYHTLKGRKDFYWLRYGGADESLALIDAYLDEVLELARWGGFDVLGHLTYPLRYMNGRDGLDVSFSSFEHKLRVLFGVLAAKELGMEVNVSGLGTAWGCAMPDLSILKLFRECGGEIVTVGSDAHSAAAVGRHVRDGQALLEAAGFRYVAAYSERSVRFEKIT